MITGDKKLVLLERFEIDTNLKKQIKKDTTLNYSESVDTLQLDSSLSGTFLIRNQVFDGTSWSSEENIRLQENVKVIDYLEYVYSQNRTLINWLKLKMAKVFLKNKNKIQKDVVKYQSIDDFFKGVHAVAKDMNVDEKSVDFYINMISKASKAGQVALVENLVAKKTVMMRELNLLKIDNIKFVTEEDIVKFYELADKTRFIKLTWIKNYTRVIPEKVLDTKYKYDKIGAFDNYAVLHFDKSGDASSMTEKEKEKAKDPILFGMIENSRKLYYIGDWIDEYCDLTLNKMLEVLEMKKVQKLYKKTIIDDIKNTSN